MNLSRGVFYFVIHGSCSRTSGGSLNVRHLYDGRTSLSSRSVQIWSRESYKMQTCFVVQPFEITSYIKSERSVTHSTAY